MTKVLIIEDDRDIAQLERDYLELNNFQVTHISNGLDGLREAQKNSYDLIIIDVMLPGVTGYEICESIREKQEVPILFVSAKSDEIDKLKGLGLGADDYITKPFSPTELIARVKNNIQRYQRLRGKRDRKKAIELNNIVVDHDSRRVTVNNNEVVFTTTEFDLLYFLISNPDIVHAKTTLLDRVWQDEYTDIATVAVHIQKIRKKIEKHPNEPKIIETVWGAGYRFNRL
jgi:DNA-binding response OmpR family regulator